MKIGDVVAENLPPIVKKEFSSIAKIKAAATEMYVVAMTGEQALWETLCQDYGLEKDMGYTYDPKKTMSL